LEGLLWAHTVFGNLKTWLCGTFHGVSPKHLQSYLDEFVFRFDRRWKEAELFPRVLHCAINAEPLTQKEVQEEVREEQELKEAKESDEKIHLEEENTHDPVEEAVELE
jgi:hypothetical protein